MFLIQNMMTRELSLHKSIAEATKAALRANRKDSDHPSFDLWELSESTKNLSMRLKWRGFLWRAFGSDFAENPWNPNYSERPA